jgi:hypothetical protein
VRHVGDRHANGLDLAIAHDRHERAVLLHEIDTARDRPVVIELEQIGALLPRTEREAPELEHAFELARQPHARQFRKARENRSADHLLRRQPAVIVHEAIPHQHVHLAVEHENAEADPFDDQIAQRGKRGIHMLESSASSAELR